MRRYWVPLEFVDKERNFVLLKDDIFHHIVHVCRQGEGNRFEVLTEEGKAYFVEIDQLDKKCANAKILETREIASLKRPYIHLAVSLPQFKKIDTILEKSVELGVKEVVLFTSDFSSLKKKEDFFDKKQSRWQRIIRSATQQSGRGDLMSIRGPLQLEELLRDFNQKSNALGLFPYEGECEVSVKAHLQQLILEQEAFEEAWVFVGSEGGFSLREVNVFKEFKLKPVSLGDQILRVETACVVLPSILKYELGI